MNGKEEIKLSDIIKFFPRQREAFNASKKFKYVLYGGSVGSGKSYFLRWSLIAWLLFWYLSQNLRGVRVGLFCEDYPALNDRHLAKIKAEFPDWLGSYNEQRHEFTLHPGYGSGVLAFRNLDDPSRYLSVEFAAIAIDEINRNPKTTFDLLRTRLRWPGIADTKFLAACNPIGEAWVKNFWVKRLFPSEEKEQMDFWFVNALPSDNPYLPESYFETLKSLPIAERQAYLEGNWDALSEKMDAHGWMRLIEDAELSRAKIPLSPHAGFVVLGVDPGAGGDASAIVAKSGMAQEVLFNQKLRDTMDLVSVTVDAAKDCQAIVVDKSGVGQGFYDRIKQIVTIPVYGLSFGEKAIDNMFGNLKAELYWRQREWLLRGGQLMEDPAWNEFEIIKYKNYNGKVIIQPKEELFRQGFSSPNVVDAAVLTQYVTDLQIRNDRALQGRVWKDKTIEIWRRP